MNNNIQHTPGPWTLEKEHLPIVVNGANGYTVAHGCGNPASQYWERNSEAAANARLIAAAPELLAALRNIESVLARMTEQNAAMNPFPLAEARAAIAKALNS